MAVLFLPEVENYLVELIEILYQKQYFGFYESAMNYVEDLIQDIKNNLPSLLKKKAPAHFDRYGKNLYYVSYRKNHNTQWYVFFSIHNDTYLVRYIANNHMCSQFL